MSVCDIPSENDSQGTQAPPIGQLTPFEAKQLGDANTRRLRIEGRRFALNESVMEIEYLQKLYDFLSVALAILLLFILWVIRYLLPSGPVLEWADRIATVVGTLISMGVILLMVWSWRSAWEGQIEKKRELASRGRELINQYLALRDEPKFELAKLVAWNTKATEFEDDLTHKLAKISNKCRQHGHQHTGISFHLECPVVCQMCGRSWEPKFVQLRKTWRSRFRGCEGCGVQT